jgi:cleavage and polyadenylation specificity factor subunit 1
MLGTNDGELGILVGVDDRSHRRLLLLQQIMGSVVESTCGLSHRDYRFIKTSKYRLDRKRNVLDGTLLWRFMDLDIKTQDELSGAMGTTADVILENLVEIDNSWGFF